MCRLFGQLASSHRTAAEPLCSAENALRTQSHLHPHGWGIAWYGARGPLHPRGVMAAHADRGFVQAGRTARSHIVLAHVRDASIGRVALENTHPFVEGRWVFAHNGTVARYKKSRAVRDALLAALSPRVASACAERPTANVASRSSSRASILRAGRPGRATLADVRTALAETVALVCAIADCGELRSTLNFLVSDGRLLCACRHGKPLHVSRSAGGARAPLFAVASEPIGRAGWTPSPRAAWWARTGALRILAAPLGLAKVSEPDRPAPPRHERACQPGVPLPEAR